jgi:hypothetical protein
VPSLDDANAARKINAAKRHEEEAARLRAQVIEIRARQRAEQAEQQKATA